jgi:imidazolonepropionase-like amidohydrolase
MIVDGPDNLRRAVRQEIKYGADWIKVMASGGVMSQHDDPEVAGYSDAELEALADEAHRHKKRITAHAHGDAGAYAAVKAGFDSIEHATMMTERTVKLMAKQGTYYVPTFRVLDWVLELGDQGGITADNLRKAKLVAEQHDKSAQMAYKHGVPMVIGSDCIFPMEEAILEFSAFAKRIPDNWYVLRAGTINAAAMLGLENEIGSLEAGKKADLVAAPANPIEDMAAVEQVDFVMKSGRIVRHDSDES